MGQKSMTWKKIARRMRVPLGFALRRCFCGWRGRAGRRWLASLLLVVPGVWLRGYAAGYVKKNAELTTTGPYAHTRNPLYLGSMMIAFGFAAAAASWVILVALAALFAAIYMPTILSEEAYLREHFAGFDAYAREGAPAAAPADACRLRRTEGEPGQLLGCSSTANTASTMLLWAPARSMLALALCSLRTSIVLPVSASRPGGREPPQTQLPGKPFAEARPSFRRFRSLCASCWSPAVRAPSGAALLGLGSKPARRL